MVSTRKTLSIAGATVLVGVLGFAGWRASTGNREQPAGPSASPSRGGNLVALLRSEPTTYVRIAETRGTAAGDLLSLLTDGRLLRVNRATDTLEPSIAERWTESPDHLAYTLTLRDDVRFSDGTPLTSADVLFSFRAAYDERVASSLAGDLRVAGEPLRVEAPDPRTVVIRLAAPFAPGARLFASLPIVPRHRLEPALASGELARVWSPATGPAGFVGSGPFVLTEHVAGQRLVFTRNPHYWRKDAAGVSLPYLDSLTVLVAPDQNTEAVRMQSGEADLMSNGDIRPEDFAAFKRLADEQRLRLIPAGLALDANQLWFNLSAARQKDPRFPWLGATAFRHAVSCAADRQAIANAVYLGEAEPVFGPVTPANRTWHLPPVNPCTNDIGKAKELLASVGLADRDGDGMLEDPSGRPARFSILTQSGNTLRERTVAMLQEQLRQAGLAVDVVGLDQSAIAQRWQGGDYDAIYFGIQNSQTDPVLSPQFWLSSGSFHFWNPRQTAPATEWERRIDDLMLRQGTTFDLAERQKQFAEVQRIFAEAMPAIYFVAPKVTLAVSSRVRNEQPAPQVPQLLWNAESLAVSGSVR